MKVLPIKSSSTNGYATKQATLYQLLDQHPYWDMYPAEYVAFRALGFHIDDATLLAYGNDLSAVEYYCYNDVADEND